MKIRTLILLVLAIGMFGSIGILVTFASGGISSIEQVTSVASSDVLIDSANTNLQNIAVGIRDSLDNQMGNQYAMVRSWALSPILQKNAVAGAALPMEELYDKWSAEAGRTYDDGEAVGDGNAANDMAPDASQYLIALSKSNLFPEIFYTDKRGYVLGASAVTGDFDQGPDDWRYFKDGGFKKHKPEPGGESWFRQANQSKDGLFIGEVEWDDSAHSWGIDIVAVMKDAASNASIGQLKAVFDYGTFIGRFVHTEGVDVYEIKVVNQQGLVVATSFDDKSKVNNEKISVADFGYFKAAKEGELVGFSDKPYTDENGQLVHSAFAVSGDVNGHIIVVSKKQATIDKPISAFVGDLKSRISKAGDALQTKMLMVGAGVAFIMFIIAAFIMKLKISTPLKKLTAVSQKLSNAEIDGLKIDVTGNDEIGEFGESFKGVLAAFELLQEEAMKGGD